jgi:putative flippase GtrA
MTSAIELAPAPTAVVEVAVPVTGTTSDTPPVADGRVALIADFVRHPENHKQAIRFACVGASGYVVTIASAYVFVHALSFGSTPAFIVSSLLGMINNFWWNRNWTFDAAHHHIGKQGMRFLTVAISVAVAAFAVDKGLVAASGMEKVMAEAVAYIIVTPFSFIAQKLWSFKA